MGSPDWKSGADQSRSSDLLTTMIGAGGRPLRRRSSALSLAGPISPVLTVAAPIMIPSASALRIRKTLKSASPPRPLVQPSSSVTDPSALITIPMRSHGPSIPYSSYGSISAPGSGISLRIPRGYLECMDLPISAPFSPMLAKAVKAMPQGDVLYEPKWDGFRCIIFRDGDEVELSSRGERPLTRYFPDLVETVKRELPERCVIDGEVIIRTGQVLDFDKLSQRIHPAASRVKLLAETTPASFVAFDLLALGEESLMERPFSERRARLETTLADAKPPIHLTHVTESYDLALQWFDQFEGAGLDGVVAKPKAAVYEPDKRVMFKVKHERTADCVVAGFRWHKSGPIVGSLLLGLYDGDSLRHVGVAASFTMARRKELLEELAPCRENAAESHPWLRDHSVGPGGAPSRWNAGKDMSFEPLRPELVVEVAYDYMEGSRFRHTAQFRRWRTDRDPGSCTFEQLERPLTYAVADVLGAGT